MITPFILIPKTIILFGFNEWGKISVAQVIGTILGIGADLSWTTYGPSRLKERSSLEDFSLVRTAQCQRLTTLLLAQPISFLCALNIEHDQNALLYYFAINFSLFFNLSNLWYWLARDGFRQFFLLESLPRFLLTLIFYPLFTSKKVFILYFISMIALCLFTTVFFPKGVFKTKEKLKTFKYRNELLFSFSRIFQTSYYLSALPLLNIFSPPQVAIYAQIERSYRLIMSATLPFAQIYQSGMMRFHSTLSQNFKKSLSLGALSAILYLFTFTPKFNQIIYHSNHTSNRVALLLIPLIVAVTSNRFIWIFATFEGIKNFKLAGIQFAISIFFVVSIVPAIKFFKIPGLIFVMITSELLTYLWTIRICLSSMGATRISTFGQDDSSEVTTYEER